LFSRKITHFILLNFKKLPQGEQKAFQSAAVKSEFLKKEISKINPAGRTARRSDEKRQASQRRHS